MEAEKWEKVIKKACRDAGTYKTFFDSVITTLAAILERRDLAEAQFAETGGNVVVSYTNKAGATNIIQNPALRVVNDLNRDALTYWRDLGLTPAGYKKLTSNVVEDPTAQGFERLLEKIGT